MDSPSQHASTQQATNEPGGKEISVLKQQLQRGELSPLRQVLAATKEKQDWQDRYFVLEAVASSILPGVLQSACAAEPNVADLALIRGVHLFDLVARSRGTKVADQTSAEQFKKALQYVQEAVPTLAQASQLTPEDPTPYVFAMRALQIASNFAPQLQTAYQKAVLLAPDFLPAYWVMINARSKKWAGSHEESLQIARSAMKNAKPGSDLAACLFLARILAWQYTLLFDKDAKGAAAYFKDREIATELNAAFDRWVQAPYQPRRSSVPYLLHAAFWYYKANDRERLAAVFSHTAGVFYDRAWSFAGNAHEAYAAALELTARKKSGVLGWFKT